KRKRGPLGSTTHYGRLLHGAPGHPGETLSSEAEAQSKGQARAEVSVLRVVRPNLSVGHTGDCLGTGACQSWRTGHRRGYVRADRKLRRGGRGLSEASSGRLADQAVRSPA